MNPSVGQLRFSIGRSADCDIVVADDTVSRRHAELVVHDSGRVSLRDCGSLHGTRVTERGQTRAVSHEFLSQGATIHFGDVAMSADDLVAAVRACQARTQGAPAPPGEPPPSPEGRQAAGGVALVRCGCGTIKPKGTRCRECGE